MLHDFVKKHNITKHLFITYFVVLAAIIYFLLSSIFGQKGLINYFLLKHELENKSLTKEDLIKFKKSKEQLIKGMSSDNLDIDLLEEQAKKNLGFVSKKEVVIYDIKTNK